MKKLMLALLFLQGCSVGMAMSGKPDPNLGVVGTGKSRGEIEMQLGTPIKTVPTKDGGRIDVYGYEIGNAPSAGRAIGHGAMDILTLGFWELLGTPIEGFIGDKYQATITYDKNDIVKNVATQKVTNNSSN